MVFSCWKAAEEEHQLQTTEEIDRKRMFDSVYTYNTDYNYGSNYTNWETQTNKYSKPRVADARDLENVPPQNFIELLFVGLSFLFILCTLPFSLLFSLKFVSDFERLVVLRLGKAQKVRGPGTTLVLPFIDKTAKIDIRVTSYDLPCISIITNDKGIAEFSAAIFCKVIDPMTSFCNIQDKDLTIKNLGYTSVYKHLARRSLHDITKPQTLSLILSKVQEDLNQFTAEMGVEVVEVTVVNINVIKQSENQAVNIFNMVMKSEVGTQMMQTLQSHFMEHVSSNQGGGANVKEMPIPLYPKQPQQSAASNKPKPFIIPNDPEVEELIKKIKQCCNSNLVAKVGKRYRIICSPESPNQIPADFIIDLKKADGWATWTTLASDMVDDVDVIFTLSKQTLKLLMIGELSPFTAYMNGDVRISGTVADAIGLKYLMERAKELRCL